MHQTNQQSNAASTLRMYFPAIHTQTGTNVQQPSLSQGKPNVGQGNHAMTHSTSVDRGRRRTNTSHGERSHGFTSPTRQSTRSPMSPQSPTGLYHHQQTIQHFPLSPSQQHQHHQQYHNMHPSYTPAAPLGFMPAPSFQQFHNPQQPQPLLTMQQQYQLLLQAASAQSYQPHALPLVPLPTIPTAQARESPMQPLSARASLSNLSPSQTQQAQSPPPPPATARAITSPLNPARAAHASFRPTTTPTGSSGLGRLSLVTSSPVSSVAALDAYNPPSPTAKLLGELASSRSPVLVLKAGGGGGAVTGPTAPSPFSPGMRRGLASPRNNTPFRSSPPPSGSMSQPQTPLSAQTISSSAGSSISSFSQNSNSRLGLGTSSSVSLRDASSNSISSASGSRLGASSSIDSFSPVPSAIDLAPAAGAAGTTQSQPRPSSPPQFTDRIIAIRPRKFHSENDMPVWSFLRASADRGGPRVWTSSQLGGDSNDPSTTKRFRSVWVVASEDGDDMDRIDTPTAVQFPSSSSSASMPLLDAENNTLENRSTFTTPNLLSSPSVRFLNSLDDASSTDEEDEEEFGRINEEVKVAWEDFGAENDSPSHARQEPEDLATTLILSMAGFHHAESLLLPSGEPAPIEATAYANMFTVPGAFNRLDTRRQGLWAESRLLAFALTAREAERVLRSFVSETDAEVSMALIESPYGPPGYTVCLQALPAAFAPSSANITAGLTEKQVKDQQVRNQRVREEFLAFLEELQEHRLPGEEVLRLVEEAAAAACGAVAASSTSHPSPAPPTPSMTSRPPPTPRTMSTPRALSTPRNAAGGGGGVRFESGFNRVGSPRENESGGGKNKRASSRGGTGLTSIPSAIPSAHQHSQSTVISLTTPFLLFSHPFHRAQCVEIVERFRDRGLRAAVVNWEEVGVPEQTNVVPSIVEESTSPSGGGGGSNETLFSLHLRLNRSADSSTDSLVRAVRMWLMDRSSSSSSSSSSTAKTQNVEYLIHSPKWLRAREERQKRFGEKSTPAASSSHDHSGSTMQLILPTSSSQPDPHSTTLLTPMAGTTSKTPEPSESDSYAMGVKREMDRIRRWASQANVQVTFDGSSASTSESTTTAAASAAASNLLSPTSLASASNETDARLAELTAQVQSLQSSLALKDSLVQSSDAERERLAKKLKTLEQAQTKLIQERMELDEQIAKGKLANGKLSKQDQYRLDQQAAVLLHKQLNIDSREARLYEETARRNVEKQRALRAQENGQASGSSDKDKAKEKEKQQQDLRQVSFDPSSSSSSTAPSFASPKNAEILAKEQVAVEEEKKRLAQQRAQGRRPTVGERMRVSETFTMNHVEMRELMQGYKELADTVVDTNKQVLDASSTGPIARQDLVLKDPDGTLTISTVDPAGNVLVPFQQLPLAQQKKIQSSQLWNAAHLPNMLDDIRRASIVPGYSEKESLAGALSPIGASSSPPPTIDGLSVVSEGSPDGSEERILTITHEGPSTQTAGDANSLANMTAPSKVAQLVSYSSGQAYDKLTGVLIEDLGSMPLRERLRRAEIRIEEAEYDDMYRRYLQPKISVLGGGVSSSKKNKRKKENKSEKSRIEKSRVEKSKRRSGGDSKDPTTRVASPKKSKRDTGRKAADLLSPRDLASPSSRNNVVSPSSRRRDGGLIDDDGSDDSSTDDDGAGEEEVKRPETGTKVKRTSSGITSPSAKKDKRKSGKSSSSKRSSSKMVLSLPGTEDAIAPGSASVGSSPTGSLRREKDKSSSSAAILAKRSSVDDLVYWVDILVSALELDNPFLLGKPDPYIEVYRCRQYIWELVASTEIASKSTSATYLPLLMSVEALCNMQLDRKILFKVWTNNRGTGRTLIGELSISLTQIQENIGSKFKIIHPGKSLADPTGYKQSGFLRFSHAELAVNTTKPTLIYPGLNVQNAASPVYKKLTNCLVRIQLSAEGLPALGTTFSSIFGKEKPDPYLEIFHLLPNGLWDTSADQPAVISASGTVGGCLYRTEPTFATTRPKFPPFILTFHSLCYGDVNRLIRIRFRHKGLTLGWVELTLKELYLAVNKKVPLKTAEEESGSSIRQINASGIENNKLSSPSAANLSEQRNAGYLILKKVAIFSHLSELPTLCANAGIERRPVPGVSDLPLQQLITQQAIEMKLEEEKEARERAKEDGSSPPDESGEPATGSLDEEKVASNTSDALPSATPVPVVPTRITRNAYRGMHHIRSKAAGKFFAAFQPIQQSVMEARQLALLMGAHKRLGAESSIGKHFLHSNIFDPHLVPFIFTFMSATSV